MMPRNVDAEAIRLDLDYGLSAQHIADWVGEPVGMVAHHLAVTAAPTSQHDSSTKPNGDPPDMGCDCEFTIADFDTVECPCCAGETEFNWFDDACDECAIAILGGRWTEAAHRHEFSPKQIAYIGARPDA